MIIKDAIKKVISKKDLIEKEMYSVFSGIMDGKATNAEIAAFLTALHMKGETVDEITGAAKVMRKKAIKINTGKSRNIILDTCGTGGTGINTFNVSTAVAIVLAASGVKIAKHGNRAASGRCGSADVLEELGVKINAPKKTMEKCIDKIGIGFLFAPLFHKAMKYAIGPRKEIGVRTIFNVLGPLCNPVLNKYQVIGVFDAKLTEKIAGVLKKLGSKRAYVVNAKDGLDEVSISSKTKVSELKNGKIKTYFIEPSDFGVKKYSLDKIKGGNAKTNAKIVNSVLSGKKGPKRDIVLINASLGLITAGKAKTLKQGVRIAEEVIDSGKALEKLDALVKMTRRK